jgi:hypothetical protein
MAVLVISAASERIRPAIPMTAALRGAAKKSRSFPGSLPAPAANFAGADDSGGFEPALDGILAAIDSATSPESLKTAPLASPSELVPRRAREELVSYVTAFACHVPLVRHRGSDTACTPKSADLRQDLLGAAICFGYVDLINKRPCNGLPADEDRFTSSSWCGDSCLNPGCVLIEHDYVALTSPQVRRRDPDVVGHSQDCMA